MNTRTIMNRFAENIYAIAGYVDNLPHRRCGVEFGSKQNPRRGMIAIEDGTLVFYEGILLLLDSKVDLATSLSPSFSNRRKRLALVCSFNEINDLYNQVCEAQSLPKKVLSHLAVIDTETGKEKVHFTKNIDQTGGGWMLDRMLYPGEKIEVYLEEILDPIHKKWMEMMKEDDDSEL